MSITIGQILAGHYKIVKSLSSGGFGETYIAEDIHRPGNPQCVLKHLKPANSSPESLSTARRLFNSEAQVLEKLGEHPQIPRLFAYFEENEEFYLVEEFIDGHPLSAELPLGQRWSEIQVKTMLEDMLGILEFVHGQGVIHRDIKPDNIMRRESDNKLVLIDFGAIKEMRNEAIPKTAQGSATVAIGTPGYMPTEQGRGKPRPSSDLYALGMIGVQALTGMFPHQLREDDETGEIRWQDQASASPALAAMLSQMIRYHFKDRYKTATEVAIALRTLGSAGSIPPTEVANHEERSPNLPPTREAIAPPSLPQPPLPPQPLPPTPNPQPKPQNKTPIWIGVGVAIILLCGVGGFAYVQSQNSRQTNVRVQPNLTPEVSTTPTPTPEATPEPEPATLLYRVVNVAWEDSLHIRSGPSANNRTMGCIPYDGIDVEVSEDSEAKGSWLQVHYKGMTGWVNSKYLSKQAGTVEGRSQRDFGRVDNPYRVSDVASNDVLYILDAPGAENKIVGCIPYDGRDVAVVGTGVSITTQIRTSMWVPIKYKGVSGWVNSTYLSQ